MRTRRAKLASVSAPVSESASAAQAPDASAPVWSRPGVRQSWLAVSVYVLGAVVLTVHLWQDPASRAVAGNPNDADQFAWFMRYGATAVAHLRLPSLVTTAMNAPVGLNVMWNPSLLLPSVLLSPVTLLFGPQVSLTLLTTVGFAGSAAAMFWVLRRWGCTSIAAFGGGLVYGFSPALTQSAIGHYDLQFAVLPPLIVDAALALLTGRGRPLRTGAWLGLLCAAQLLTDEELLLDTVLAVLVLAAVLAASRWRSAAGRVREVAAGLGAAVAAAALVAGYPLWTQFRGSLRQHGSPFTLDFFKNDLAGFVKPSALLVVHSASSAAFAASYRGGLPEYLGYLGWPLLGLLAVAAIGCWPVLAVRMAAVAFVVLAVCSLGGSLMVNGHDYEWLKLPWYWVQSLPVAGSALPNRISIITGGAAAALFAFGADTAWRIYAPARAVPLLRSMSRSMSVGRLLAAAVAVIAVVPLIPEPLPSAAVPGVPAGWAKAFGELRLPESASVLTVPVPTATFTAPMRWQAASGVPSGLVGGYFIGPASNGQAYVEGAGLPGAAYYLDQLWLESGRDTIGAGTGGITGPVPPVTAGQFRAQLAAWHPAAVLAVTSRESALGRYLISALGEPAAASGDVLGWRLPPRG